MTKYRIGALLAAILLTLTSIITLAGCGKEDDEEFTIGDPGETIMVQIEMENGGKMTLELYPEKAPITCENFKALADKGFYNGLIFHRVIAGFMIQGGCPEGTGMGGPGYTIKGEFSSNGVKNDLKHQRGVISMARTNAPNSAGSQFFIMHMDAPHLDAQYAGFGKVTEGLDVLDAIASVKTGSLGWYMQDVPKTPVVIETIEVVE